MRATWRLLALCGALGWVGCRGSEPDPPRTADRITVTSGDAQAAVVGALLPQPITFLVADGDGPLAGVTVTFAASDPTAFLSATTATSGTTGTVSVRWTVGGTIGTQSLTATVAGVSPATAAATVAIGPPALLTPLSTSSQFVVVGGTVAIPPAVRVSDAFSNPIPNQQIAFVDLTDRSTIEGATAITDAEGRAAATSWQVGRAPGTYSIQALAGADVTATFVAYATPASIRIGSGNNQAVNAGTPLLTAPTVAAFDSEDQPVEGVTISFEVTGGDGRIVGTGAGLTGSDGLAAAPQWILGLAPGANELTAETIGLPPVVITATGVAAVPASAVVVSPPIAEGLAGSFASGAPAIRITDAGGQPVAGAPVTFTATGGGLLTGADATTDFEGTATLGGWRLGSGPQSVTATVAGLPPVVFITAAQPVPASGYSIDVRFLGPTPTTSQRAAFTEAAARWSAHILGDLADVLFVPDPAIDPMDFCGNAPLLDEIVDDLVVFARIDQIDGPGGVLGRAFACYLREDDYWSIIGTMEFDKDDVVALQTAGRFRDVVLHEMGHVIGMSANIWDLKGLIAGRSTVDPYFVGPSARMAFRAAAGPAALQGNMVPLENSGGQGTRDSHWRESILSNELMTGFLDNGANPLSAVTVSALRDMGYVVTDANADEYSFAMALRAATSPPLSLHRATPPPIVRIKGRHGSSRPVVDFRSGRP